MGSGRLDGNNAVLVVMPFALPFADGELPAMASRKEYMDRHGDRHIASKADIHSSVTNFVCRYFVNKTWQSHSPHSPRLDTTEQPEIEYRCGTVGKTPFPLNVSFLPTALNPRPTVVTLATLA